MRVIGLEPTHRLVPDSKSGASANSATLATAYILAQGKKNVNKKFVFFNIIRKIYMILRYSSKVMPLLCMYFATHFPT